MATNFGAKLAKLVYTPFIWHTGVPKGLAIAISRALNFHNLFIFCISLMSFLAVTAPQIMMLQCFFCIVIWQKRHIQPIISEYAGPIFTQFKDW